MASTSNPRFREKNLHKAQIAIEAGRFGDSVQFMMDIVKSIAPWTELSLSERKLLYTALTKFSEDYRQTWNNLNSRSFSSDGIQSEVVKFYLNEITEQMLSACTEMKHFIYRWLIHSSRSAEATVFYLTLNADVSCYLVELQEDEEVQTMANAVVQAFKDAKAVAKARLTWASPARLTLALHMSEFYADTMQMPEKGVKIARKALARACAATGTVTDEESLKEIHELMSKLIEYIYTWTNDEDGEAEASTSIADFLAGAIMAQVAWSPDTSDKAATFKTPLAAKDPGTSGTISALQSEPGAEAGTSTSLANFVPGTMLAQVTSPPDISDKAIPFKTQPAVEEVGTFWTISALQSEPAAETGTSTSLAKFVPGTIFAQVTSPPDISDKAIAFRTQPAVEEVETSGTISALQSEPGAEAGTSETLSMPVASKSEAGNH